MNLGHATKNENFLPVMTEDRRPETGCLPSVGLPSPVGGRIYEGGI
jgi:hypothetical protein